MSSYFDELSSNVASITEEGQAFLLKVRDIEQGLLRNIEIVLAQPELPEELKTGVEKAIADYAVPENVTFNEAELPKTLNDKKMHFNVSLHQSCLIEAMHDFFHAIAEKRITTKYGRIMDNPRFFAQTVREVEVEKLTKV